MKLVIDFLDCCMLLNDLWAIQLEKWYISDQSIKILVVWYQFFEVEIEGVVFFYYFFYWQFVGQYIIYVNNSVIVVYSGMGVVIFVFEEVIGVWIG